MLFVSSRKTTSVEAIDPSGEDVVPCTRAKGTATSWGWSVPTMEMSLPVRFRSSNPIFTPYVPAGTSGIEKVPSRPAVVVGVKENSLCDSLIVARPARTSPGPNAPL